MRTNGWQDNIDDIGQTLSFMCYYKYDGNYFVLKDAGNLETFDITVPYISTENSGTRVTISLCILAYDKYLASSKSCIDLKNVMVTYSETTLLDFIAAAELADMSDNDVMLYTAASLEVLIPKYFRSPVQPHICTVDFQCYNGKCFLESGSNYCKCDQGYFGTN